MTTAAVEPRAGERAPLGALSTDHKAVAIRLAWLCGAFFLAGGVLALLVRSELAVPGMQIVSHQGYDQLFTMHGSTMVYLVVQPLAVALGVYLVPLQIGAANLIAPRAALFAVWILAGGGALMYLGFLTHTAPAAPDGRRSCRSRATGSSRARGWTCGSWAWRSRTSPSSSWPAVVLLTHPASQGARDDDAAAPAVLLDDVVTCLMVVFSFPALIVAMGP